MEIKKIKFSINLYNGKYQEGSIFESSVNIVMSQNIFDKSVEKITKDAIASATFKRSFMDNNLNLVTIEIPLPIIDDVKHLMSLVDDIVNDDSYKLIKTQSFNLKEYLNKITIKINDVEEYEIDKNIKLAKDILVLSKLEEMATKTNKQIIESIDI